jgi:hypothetical protein
MDVTEALRKYREQQARAHARGIEWRLTFHEWFTWWGDDLDRRGVGHDELQMQRFGDSGPYALWNIRKGYPRDNAATAAKVKQHSKAVEARQDILRAEFEGPTRERRALDEDLGLTDDDKELLRIFQPRRSLAG